MIAYVSKRKAKLTTFMMGTYPSSFKALWENEDLPELHTPQPGGSALIEHCLDLFGVTVPRVSDASFMIGTCLCHANYARVAHQSLTK